MALCIDYQYLNLCEHLLDRTGDKVLKGQIISKQNCGALIFFKKYNESIARISAQATKMGQIGKIKAHYHAN